MAEPKPEPKPRAAASPKRPLTEKPLPIEKIDSEKPLSEEPASYLVANTPVDRSGVDKTVDFAIPESPKQERTSAVVLFYSLLAMAVGLGTLSVVAKLRPRSQSPSVNPEPEYKRRAALEALLAIEKKKK
jgi:hypothetical protein